jgi:hypothetical protein
MNEYFTSIVLQSAPAQSRTEGYTGTTGRRLRRMRETTTAEVRLEVGKAAGSEWSRQLNPKFRLPMVRSNLFLITDYHQP